MLFCSNPFPNYQFIINIPPPFPKFILGKNLGEWERETHIMFDRMEGGKEREGRKEGRRKEKGMGNKNPEKHLNQSRNSLIQITSMCMIGIFSSLIEFSCKGYDKETFLLLS